MGDWVVQMQGRSGEWTLLRRARGGCLLGRFLLDGSLQTWKRWLAELLPQAVHILLRYGVVAFAERLDLVLKVIHSWRDSVSKR